MFARIGIVRALNRNEERTFDSTRKDTRWGKREAKGGSMKRSQSFLTTRNKHAGAVAAVQIKNAGSDHNTHQFQKPWLDTARSS